MRLRGNDGHRFLEDLACECGVSWTEHQLEPKRCAIEEQEERLEAEERAAMGDAACVNGHLRRIHSVKRRCSGWWCNACAEERAARKAARRREGGESVGDQPWKAFERRVAAVFGLKRRGADFGDREGGKNDAVNIDGSESEHWSIECKLLARPGFADMLAAARQAEAAAKNNQEPVAIIKNSGRGKPDADALVVQRLATFRQWRID